MKARTGIFIAYVGALAAALVLAQALHRENPHRFESCEDLHSAICGTASARDPTGRVGRDEVGEREAARILNEISTREPGLYGDALQAALAREIYTVKRVRRVASAFGWVTGALVTFLEALPESALSPAARGVLVRRVRSVRLEWPSLSGVNAPGTPVPGDHSAARDTPGSYADDTQLYLKNNVYLERAPGRNPRLRIGGAYLLGSSSWFNQVFTLAHEIAHSIDACELGAPIRREFPALSRLETCLRESGVLPADPSQACGATERFSEVFADWLATAITAQALADFATEFGGSALIDSATNAVRDLCGDETGSPESSDHPDARTRINQIFGASPAIREILGCERPTRSCELK